MIDINEYPIKDFWGNVKKRKGRIIVFASACLLVASLYIYNTQPAYRVSQKVILDEDLQSSISLDIIQAVHSTGILQNEQLNGRIEDLTSPEIITKVVTRLGLEISYYRKQFLRTRELYSDAPINVIECGACVPYFSFVLTKGTNGVIRIHGLHISGSLHPDFDKDIRLGDTLKTPAGQLLVLPTNYFENWKGDVHVIRTPAEVRAATFSRNLQAKAPPKKTSVILLTLEDISSERAKAILSTLIDAYEQHSADIRDKTNRAVLDFLAARIADLEKELGNIEDQIKNFKQRHHITDIGQAGNTLYAMSTTYGNKAFDISNQLAIAKMIRDFITDPSHVNDLLPANSGLANSALIARINEYNSTMLEKDRALAVSSEDNPHVLEKTNSLNRIRISIVRSIDSLIGSLKLELERQLDRERDLLGRVAKNSEEALDLLGLERQRKIKEQLYVYLLQKKEENELKSLLNVGKDFHTMPPSGGSAPVSPQKAILLLAALLLGLFVPAFVIYFATLYDGSVRKPSDMKAAGIPFLGSIPQLSTHSYRRSQIPLAVKRDEEDAVNDAFRMIRTRLDALGPWSSPVFLITSPGNGSGKSFTALNLAEAMSLKGVHSIVVDADMRKSALSTSMNCTSSKGMADYLRGDTDDVLSSVIRSGNSVDFLPAGNVQGNPAELLVSSRAEGLLQELRHSYDYIFLDCPPMETVADTSILAARADLGIIVLKAGKYEKRLLPELAQHCKDGGHQRMATVLNCVE